MPYAQRRCLGRSLAFAAALFAIVCPAAYAKEASASIKDAEQYLAKGDLKAAEIELRNAIRESPEDPVLRARLAQVYLRLGDPVAAEREARAARARNGNEADYLPVLANALLRQQKFSDVLQLIQLGDRDPALESKLRTALGVAANGLGDRDKARAMLRDAIRLDQSAPEPKIQLALVLTWTNPAEADKLIDEAIAGSPRSVDALQLKGEMLRARGDADAAMHLFDEVLKIDPKNLAARLSRASVNIGQGKFAAADEDLDPILQATPDSFMANYLRALELAKQQKFAEADQILDRVSQFFDRLPAGYYVQGATKLALGQSAQAEAVLRKYLARASGDPSAVRLIASAALRQRAPSRAIDYLKPLVDKSPADAATLSLLGNAYMADSKPELALQQFEKASALDPENPTIKTRAAISEINAGRGQEGLAALEQVFASQSGTDIAGPALVLTNLRAGRVDKASEVATSLAQRDADSPLYQVLLGEVRAAQRDYAGAETAFRAALTRDPGFMAATRDLAQLYQATGRVGDAEKIYNDLLSKKADDVTALLGLADVAIAQQKWSEATDFLNNARAAAKIDPTPGLKLVSLYQARRDWNSAKAVAAELGEQFPRDVKVLKALGRARLAAGDTDGAISSYKRAYQLAPTSIPILSDYVALLKQAKYFREAWDVLQDAVARDPQNTSMKADLIRTSAEIDGADAAVSRAREFAKGDPDNTLYDRLSSELFEKAGRPADAAALLEKALAARPADDDLTVALSRLYGRMGDFGKAEAVLTARLKSDPKDIAVNSALAPLYVMTGHPDDAKRVFSDVLSQRPNDVAALYGLADIFVVEKKWPEAMDYISRARTAAPNDLATGLLLVNMYGLRQDWKNAIATGRELVEKFPGNIDVIDKLGRVQIAAGDTDGALSTYKNAYETNPNSSEILSGYLNFLKETKNFPEMLTVLQAAVRRDPQSASFKGDMIRVTAEIDGLDAGLAAARNFAASDPENSVYDVVAAELYEKAGRGDEAVALLEKAIAARRSDSRLTTALSRLYIGRDMPAKAEALLTARLKADPTDVTARSALALYYAQQKRDVAAIAEYSRVVDDHPADAAALNNLAYLYQRQGELAKARELAQRAFAIAPRNAAVDDTLGWILLSQGEADGAVVYLSAANLSAPRDLVIQYHLAVALHRAGRAADARVMLEGLLSSGGSFEDKTEAERLLQELKRG